jgi:hypothetical protein
LKHRVRCPKGYLPGMPEEAERMLPLPLRQTRRMELLLRSGDRALQP